MVRAEGYFEWRFPRLQEAVGAPAWTRKEPSIALGRKEPRQRKARTAPRALASDHALILAFDCRHPAVSASGLAATGAKLLQLQHSCCLAGRSYRTRQRPVVRLAMQASDHALSRLTLTAIRLRLQSLRSPPAAAGCPVATVCLARCLPEEVAVAGPLTKWSNMLPRKKLMNLN